ncbi:hypothetical protein [Burkholderia pseudomallei]|uniref:hypothetical protein n=1 Tax=Burkholderia pseudomallei TaxID=28450 RepID=UPI001F1C2AFF|nr:hypothetical protein [Burkholderia pseudomallei]
MNLIVNLILKIMSVRLVVAFDKWCLIVERMFFTKGEAGDARMEMIGRVILIDAFLEKSEMVAATCGLPESGATVERKRLGRRRGGDRRNTGHAGAAARRVTTRRSVPASCAAAHCNAGARHAVRPKPLPLASIGGISPMR